MSLDLDKHLGILPSALAVPSIRKIPVPIVSIQAVTYRLRILS